MSIIGIDLGTTNTAVAFYEGNNASIISNSEGYRTTPSIVSFKENEVIVGELAKRQKITNSTNTISSIKRKIGSDYFITINNKKYLPEDISSEILKKIKNDSESFLGYEIKDAVITVPAYFNDTQRNITKRAGELAGLNVVRIINEPTAAAFAYGYNNSDKDLTILVYDLGGGTFDVSLLGINNGIIEVKATSGINDLGGDDWDFKLAEYIKSQICIKYNHNFKFTHEEYLRILESAEKAKIELSSVNETTINIPYLTSLNNIIISFQESLSRETFETITSELLERTKEPILQVLKDTNLSFSNVDEIILVGGSTRMTLVTSFLKKLSNDTKINKSVNPDEAVALGAALQGGILDGKINNTILLDVTPLSLGIKTKGGIMHKIIDRNSTIPISKNEIFSTAEDDQNSVVVEVYQGEREFVKDNLFLGTFQLEDIPIAKQGIPEIIVTFSIDVNGIVSVSAEESFSKKINKIIIKNTQNVSEEIIKENLENNENYKENDKNNIENIKIINNKENIIKTTNQYLLNNFLSEDHEYRIKLKNLFELYNLEIDSNKKIEILKELRDLQYLIAEYFKEHNKNNT